MAEDARQAEFERIRGYLQVQAAKHPLDELERRVQEGVDELHRTARSFGDAPMDVHPPGDEWSPMDCLRHIVRSDAAVATQILHVALTGELPVYEEPGVDGNRDELLAHHIATLQSLYEHVRAADPGANLEVRWKHPFFGDLNWREWFLFLRIHCLDHGRQLAAMREALASS